MLYAKGNYKPKGGGRPLTSGEKWIMQLGDGGLDSMKGGGKDLVLGVKTESLKGQ